MTRDIAILIPAYNAAETIGETLESIQNQGEGLDRVAAVVVADDASRDNTLEVAERIWRCGVPLHLIRNEQNRGERRTVNDAVQQLPPGVRWFLILHSDDVAKPNWLSRMLWAIDGAGERVGSVSASYDVLFPSGRIERGEDLGEDKMVLVHGEPAAVADTLNRGCWWKISSCAIRVTAFHDLSGFAPDMPQLGDLDFLLRLMIRQWDIAYLPLCLSVYRQTEQSVSSVSFLVHRDIREWLRILNRYEEYLKARDRAVKYLRLAKTLMRRLGKSLLSGEWTRARSAAALLPAVATAGLRSTAIRGGR